MVVVVTAESATVDVELRMRSAVEEQAAAGMMISINTAVIERRIPIPTFS